MMMMMMMMDDHKQQLHKNVNNNYRYMFEYRYSSMWH